MRRERLGSLAAAGLAALLAAAPAPAAEPLTVRALVPRFGGPPNLSTSVSTILSLQLWTTLRPRPAAGSADGYFGAGEVTRSTRVIDQLPEDAERALRETASQLALLGAIDEYGDGIVVTTSVVIAPQPAGPTPRVWQVARGPVSLELDLPSLLYQFSPLLLSRALVSRYSVPDRLRLCPGKVPDCDGTALRPPYRAIRQDGDYALVRQHGGRIGWVFLPELSSAQGEMVGMVAALISYLRGDFEQARTYFSRVLASKAESLVKNDARLLAAVSAFRGMGAIEPLRAAQQGNRYSRFGVQALVMAEVSLATRATAEADRRTHAAAAAALVESYRHLFAPADRWLRTADEILRRLR